jgi:hypothetical protein
MRGQSNDRPKFVGWLTEAQQISEGLPQKWSVYRRELSASIGLELSDGDVYAKTQNAHAIAERLISAIGSDEI